MFYQKTHNGIKIHLKVTPNAQKNHICDIILDALGRKSLHIRLKAIPEYGKANKELIRFLAKELNIPQADIELVAGEASRFKVVLVKGNADVLEDIISSILPA
jgi:uncharacterized protein (TIGR00251 family)